MDHFFVFGRAAFSRSKSRAFGKISSRRSGAKHLNLWTEEGLQQMTFGMDLKNLWLQHAAGIGVRGVFWLGIGVCKPCKETICIY